MYALREKVSSEMNNDSLKHFIYMDDRTVVARSKEEILRSQQIWREVATDFHLLGNPDKVQTVDLSREKNSFEVLGATLGQPLPVDFKKSKTATRLEDTVELYRRIKFLPESFSQRMKDTIIFGKGKLACGWIALGPTLSWQRTLQTEVWRSLGRTQYSAATMRRIIAGASLHLDVIVLIKQIRLLQQRNTAMVEMYRIDSALLNLTPLDKMVSQGLQNLGWEKDDRFAPWRHALCPEGFTLDEVADGKRWKTIAHLLRESYRCQAFDDHKLAARHEVTGQDLGEYDPDRRHAAIKWAKGDTLAYTLILGAVRSPLQRSMTEHRYQSVCPRCNFVNPHWDHLWKCFANVVPADVLLRRYCWPKDGKDQALCTAFLKCMKDFD